MILALFSVRPSVTLPSTRNDNLDKKVVNPTVSLDAHHVKLRIYVSEPNC